MPHKAKPIFSPPSPGEILKTHIIGSSKTGNRITQEDLAKAMKVSRRTVNEILHAKRAVTATMALKLAHVLSTSPEVWLELQYKFDLFHARQELGQEVAQLTALK